MPGVTSGKLEGCFSLGLRAAGRSLLLRSMQFTLLVLAAGMGSRYGGLKQIDPVGPSGETILDYSVFDALRAGFNRVVFVIRRDFETVFREQIGAKYIGRLAVDYVFQSVDDLPEGFSVRFGREKPWGTGHATWCARQALSSPFAVINADDFYGVDSFLQLAAFLSTASPAEAAMVGFRLAQTLSENGAVSRGLCTLTPEGRLSQVVERTGILASDVGSGAVFNGAEIVSMNCWGFMPAFFPKLDKLWREFLEKNAAEASNKAEFYLPAAVSSLIERRELEVRVLPTESRWFGVTYREDKARVTQALAERVRAGEYPASLWS